MTVAGEDGRGEVWCDGIIRAWGSVSLPRRNRPRPEAGLSSIAAPVDTAAGGYA